MEATVPVPLYRVVALTDSNRAAGGIPVPVCGACLWGVLGALERLGLEYRVHPGTEACRCCVSPAR